MASFDVNCLLESVRLPSATLPPTVHVLAGVRMREASAGAHVEKSLCILLDASASMFAERRMVRALATILESADPACFAALHLVAFAERQAQLPFAGYGQNSGTSAMDLVRARALGSGTSLGAALGHARGLLSGAPESHLRRILVVTDGVVEPEDEAAVAAEVQKLADAGISLVAAAVGPDADAALLQRSCEATGGKLMLADDSDALSACLRSHLQELGQSASARGTLCVKLIEGSQILEAARVSPGVSRLPLAVSQPRGSLTSRMRVDELDCRLWLDEVQPQIPYLFLFLVQFPRSAPGPVPVVQVSFTPDPGAPEDRVERTIEAAFGDGAGESDPRVMHWVNQWRIARALENAEMAQATDNRVDAAASVAEARRLSQVAGNVSMTRRLSQALAEIEGTGTLPQGSLTRLCHDARTSELAPSAPAAPGDRLVLEGPTAASFPLAGSQVWIGLAGGGVVPGVDLGPHADGRGVAPHHARLVRGAHGWELEASPQGGETCLNDPNSPLHPGLPVPLRTGDRIIVGGCVLRLETAGAPQPVGG